MPPLQTLCRKNVGFAKYRTVAVDYVVKRKKFTVFSVDCKVRTRKLRSRQFLAIFASKVEAGGGDDCLCRWEAVNDYILTVDGVSDWRS